jgi:hypothetical protein
LCAEGAPETVAQGNALDYWWKGTFALQGQTKTSAAFIGMPLQGGNRLHHLSQGVALGYGVFGLSAKRKNFLPTQNPG